MNDNQQTKLGVQNSQQSRTRVRRLDAEQLGIQVEEDSEEENGNWGPLRDAAIEVASEGIGAAVRTTDERKFSGQLLTKGRSRNVHAVELAIWKAFGSTESPISAVVFYSEELVLPCGRCLQVIRDFSGKEDVTVQVTDGETVEQHLLEELIPQ